MPSRKPTNSPAAALNELDLTVALMSAIELDNGQKFVPQAWQVPVIADRVSGIRELHIRIPEENGKTTWVAADNLVHLVTHHSPRAVVAARNEKQAKILYNQAVAMVEATPKLGQRLLIRDGTNEIRLKGRRGNVGMQVIPADELSAHGGINTKVTIDEMHALPGLGLYRVLSGKLGKREGAQFIGISTAGEPDSEYELMWAEMLASPSAERHGPRCTRVQGPQHIAWCWALEKDDDWNDMALVKLANPLESITEASLQAKRDLPGFELAHWLKVVCNVPTRDFVLRFLPEAEWAAASCDEVIDDIPADVPVTVGIDWGFGDDATAVVPLWRDSDGSLLLGRAAVIEPPRNGTQLDPEVVKAELIALNARNPFEIIAHDQGAHGGGHLMTPWLAAAFPNAVVTPVTPQASADAAGHFLERLRAGELRHVGDATLTRHLLNAIRVPVKDDPEKFYVRRPKSSRHAPDQRAQREIDAADAAVLAVWGTVGAPPPEDEPFLMFL